MRTKIFTAAAIVILLMVSNVYSKPRVEFLTSPYVGTFSNVIQEQVRFNANNIDTWIQNTGIFNQDIRTNNTPGMMWPKGANRFAIFTAGVTIGTYIDGILKLASASYKGEYAPGYINIVGGVPTPVTNTDFRLYKVTSTDSTSTDYINWYKMIPYGAPYVDRNNNGQWDVGIDRPGIKNATQTIFLCMTDGFPETHTQSEGFSGGTAPIFSEIRLTAWGYTGDSLYSLPLNDVQYISYVIINKSTKNWNNTGIGLISDTDLGDAADDYVGCDTALNLAYSFNGDNSDGNGNPPSYGQNPPAVGYDYVLSPGRYTGNQNDSVVYYDPPGSNKRVVKKGYKEMGMTSFIYYMCAGCGAIQCILDPSQPPEAYNYLMGMKKDGSAWFHPYTKQRVKKLFTGDPQTGEGWTEFGYNGNVNMAEIRNCLGGDTVTTFPNPPGDRRLISNVGRQDYTVNANDTVRLIIAQMIARGNGHKNSVTKLKILSRTAQIFYDINFDLAFNTLPAPVVTKSITPFTSTTCGLNIYWNDIAEYFKYTDTIFEPPSSNNTYRFQGYEVYEVNKNLSNNNLPDFGRPATINPSDIKLLKIFDRRDTIGVVVDTLPTGVFINGNELYSPLPIVPPYGLGMPTEFPESGLSRLLKVNQTAFPQNYGGSSAIQYGQTYKFIVCAYAVSDAPNVRRGFKVIRNPLSSVVFSITPQPYSNNITFNLHNGDTITTNKRDLGLKPVVVGQEYVQSAKYRVFFNTPDTTYSILKSTNNGASFISLKDGLKAGFNSRSHDSSRIYDGILFKTEKIKTYNVGVIKDPTLPVDSIQTKKYGWDYLPNNNYVTGSKYFPTSASLPYQSKLMSMTFPLQGTFNNLKSLMTADQLRKVKIVFSNTNKQYAYRYRDTSAATDNFFIYQSMTQVPFKVYMVDSTLAAPRQLNCAFVESNDVQSATGQWAPGADTLGRKLLLYVFNSSYDTSITSYKTKNLFISINIDIMYVWAPRLLNASANFTEGDSLLIYPYTVTTQGAMYEFMTYAPTVPIISISSEVPDKYDLMQNYPNPFNPVTKIKFDVARHGGSSTGDVKIVVYDVMGREVRTLVNQRMQPGTYETTFDGSVLSSGVYFYRLIVRHGGSSTEGFTQTKRMVLLK